jgi:hypothetical protein
MRNFLLLFLLLLTLPALSVGVTDGVTTVQNFRNLSIVNGEVTNAGNGTAQVAFTNIFTSIDADYGDEAVTSNWSFTTGGATDTLIVSHSSGAGIALDIDKGGDGEGLRVTKSSGAGNAVTIAGGALGTSGDINMSAETASRAVYFDASKNIKSSTVTATELGYLSGVTSAIQTQLGAVDAVTLDGIDSTSFLRSDANDSFTASTLTIDGNGAFNQSAYFDAEVDDGNSSTADTIDWGTGNHHKSTMTGNCTYTFTAPAGPTTLTLKLVQSSGSNTATWPATVKWPSGTAPTLSTAASAIDFISCYYDGTNYYCQSGLNFQ